MRAFIVLSLLAVACAQSGYNYEIGGGDGDVGAIGAGIGGGDNGGGYGVGAGASTGPSFAVLGSDGGPSFGASSSGHSFDFTNAGPSFDASSAGPSFDFSNAGPSFGVSSSGPSFDASSSGPSFQVSSSGPSFGASSSAPSFGVSGPSEGSFGAAASNNAPVQSVVEKEFYTFTADEDDFNEPAASNQLASSVKVALRIIFIKSPESSDLENAVLGLAQQASNQQTIIYVLNKQADLSALADKLNTASSNVDNKPEVHFIKYRTPEDALNARKTLEAEYETLGGQTEYKDGGVAPTLNFASQAPVAPSGEHGSYGAATSEAYLPASIHNV